MTNVQIEAGTLTANREDRIVSGLLLPFGEVGNTNLGKFSVPEDRVAIPQDVTVLAANTDHDRENPVARFMTAVATKAGIVATFAVGKNPEGDALLAEVASKDANARKKLSAEIKNVVIRNGQLVSGALFGAAFVKAGAFPSATVLAADVGEPDNYASHSQDTYTDENGITWTRVYDTNSETTVEDDGTTRTETTTTTTVVEETAEPAAPANPEEDSAVGVPNTLTAAKTAQHTTTESRLPNLRSIYAAVAAVKAGDQGEARTLLAALSDIKISGAGALPGAGVLRENWVGQLWQGKTYERQYVNLSKLGTDISAAGKSGFKIHRGTSAAPKDNLGGDWNGNKSDVPTGQGYTDKFGSTLDRFAFAADVAREFYDLPGGEDVIEAFFRLITEDYAEWSDGKALALYLATAGAPVAPKAYPAQINKSLGQLIQGILAVKRAKDVPTYAIVNATAYEQLLYTPKDLVPEFISFEFSTELTGSADGGKVTVVEADDSNFATIKAGEPAVLVGAKNAIEFDELGQTPLQIDALEVAKGGVDRGVHGYLQKFVVRPEALVLVGTVAP